MAAPDATDVLVVSIRGTTGWASSSRELTAGLERAGARARLLTAPLPRRVRTFMLTDLLEALAVRRTAGRELALRSPAAVIYCSMTAALLWPRPGAVWVDSLAAENRPGRHGVWQRLVEQRRLADAPLVLTMAPGSLDSLPVDGRPPAVTVPVAIEPSGPSQGPRDIDVLAYAADPVKRRLDLILDAWGRARGEGETLVVAGRDGPGGASIPPGVRFAGRLAPDRFRELTRRARVFVAAPRREDFGIAALEALADGCQLVSTPAPGPYPALELARRLDSRLVTPDLPRALRLALDDASSDYAARAKPLLEPFRRSAIDAVLSERVLPRLLPGWTRP
jgi:hypothetical protein